MTTAFIGLLLGVLAISFVGIVSARAARKQDESRRSVERRAAGRSRTLDHAAKLPAPAPTPEPDRNKSSNEAIDRALAGSRDESLRR